MRDSVARGERQLWRGARRRELGCCPDGEGVRYPLKPQVESIVAEYTTVSSPLM